jgi:hypothetical protein
MNSTTKIIKVILFDYLMRHSKEQEIPENSILQKPPLKDEGAFLSSVK